MVCIGSSSESSVVKPWQSFYVSEASRLWETVVSSWLPFPETQAGPGPFPSSYMFMVDPTPSLSSSSSLEVAAV